MRYQSFCNIVASGVAAVTNVREINMQRRVTPLVTKNYYLVKVSRDKNRISIRETLSEYDNVTRRGY